MMLRERLNSTRASLAATSSVLGVRASADLLLVARSRIRFCGRPLDIRKRPAAFPHRSSGRWKCAGSARAARRLLVLNVELHPTGSAWCVSNPPASAGAAKENQWN
jgi:hypothetical protein